MANRMTIGVPANQRAVIEEFLAAEGLDWETVGATQGRVNVVEREKGAPCDLRTLHPEGWIACSTALAWGETYQLSSQAVGRLLNLLEIRIRECQLGCFP